MEKVYSGNLVDIFKIEECIYYRKANLPIRMQCNSAFIVGTGGVAIVDIPPEGTEMIDEAWRLFDRPITTLFLTHAHWDHTGDLENFIKNNSIKNLNIFCSKRLLETIAPEIRQSNVNFTSVDGLLNHIFSGGIEIELFSPADVMHSPSDMFVYVKGHDILCTGDAVVEYQTAYYQSADIHRWISNLRQLAKWQGKFVLAGHGDMLFPWSYINDFADFLVAVKQVAHNCLRLYKSDSGLTDIERFKNISTNEVEKIVNEYFYNTGDITKYIEDRAGPEDARRQVRMVAWEFIREFIR